MSKEHHLKISRTARFYTLGELNENTKQIWFVLHGYGQLAQYFIKKFKGIVDENTFIVAPEALSRFYLDEQFTRVGATWMTREMREIEIEEYIDYLNKIYDNLLIDKDLTNIEVNILGFSQGCATAGRWLGAGHIKCNKLLFWAGFFANGVQEIIDPKKLENIETFYVYGTKDEFIVKYPDMIKKFQENLIAELNPKIFSFDGGHTIDEKTLTKISKFGN